MKNAIIGLGTVLLLVVIAWLVTFGTTAPCDGLRAQAAAAYSGEPAEVRDVIADATRRMSVVQCTVAGLRLKAGDKSAVFVTVIRK